MFGLSEGAVATLVLCSVAVSYPCFLYGAWIMLDSDDVTWGVLVHHLTYIGTGLTLTTVPLLVWMVPRLFGLGGHASQFEGLTVLHAFLGAQAYALLTFGLTGIVRVFRAKWEHDLYHDYDEDVLLEEIGDEKMRFWRRRIRIGVFGYTAFWTLSFLTGVVRYAGQYL